MTVMTGDTFSKYSPFPPDRPLTLMGIINITDDSFYPGSRLLGEDGRTDGRRLCGRIERMLSDGAGIIDIGACSSRPGSVPVPEEEEWRRLEPVLKTVAKEFPHVRFSIDTFRSGIAEKAYGIIGNFIVNDISAGDDDPAMLPLVGRLSLGYVAMHKRPSGSAGSPEDVTENVRDYFRDFAAKARDNGINDWILDPGFGFAKDIAQNYELLSRLEELKEAGRPVLVGVSRKSMVYRKFNITPDEALPGTQALHLAALERGADILRVHDVKEAAQTVEIYRAVESRR